MNHDELFNALLNKVITWHNPFLPPQICAGCGHGLDVNLECDHCRSNNRERLLWTGWGL